MRYSFLQNVFLVTLLGLSACSTLENDPDGDDLVEVRTYRITGVSVEPTERIQEGTRTNIVHTDTLRTRIWFEVVTQAEVVDVRWMQLPPCPAGADCARPDETINPTVKERRWMRFDAPIRYKERWLDAGTNLLDDEELVAAFDGSRLDLSFPWVITPYAVAGVTMKADVFEIAEGRYEIEFGWGTADGEIFTDTVQVYIDM